MSGGGAHRSRQVLAGAGGALLGVVSLLLATFACGPPPEGWPGAGRNQTLPAPQPESGAAATGDTGNDSTSPGPDPTPTTDFDAGDDRGVTDAGDAG
jgi:hypothetical protein